MPIDLSMAWEHFRAGDLGRAAQLCESGLAEQPDRADALHLLALVALRRGDPGRALVLIERAVAVQPEEADYHAALAEACWALGNLDRTVESCRQALRLRPESPEILCNLGATLVDRGDVDAAIACFRDAIRLRPEFAEAHNNLGNALRLGGDPTGALWHFRQAARLDPSSAEARTNLGKMLLERGEAEEAMAHSLEAVRLRPDLFEPRMNLGNVLHVIGRLDEAESCFREMIRHYPNRAGPHAGLAGVQEQLGDVGPSLASLREALRLNPRHAGVLARLATRLRDSLPEADEAAIDGLLADPRVSSDQKWPLLYGKAHVLDGRGEFDRAAGFIREANSLQLADLERRGSGYNPEAHTAFVDQVLAAFTPEFFERVRGWGPRTDRFVFIVGMPRSGTTLVEQILASHPRAFGAGELTTVRETFEALPEVTGRDGSLRECLDRIDRASLQALARRYCDAMEALNRSAERTLDKMPENTLYLGLIAALFPGSRLIHCRRDVRDVALSCSITNFGQVRWACDPAHVASRINQYLRVMDHWRRALPVPIFEVDYEAVVADPAGMSRELVAWCGLDWDPACLEYYNARRAVRTASATQVRRPIYQSSVGRWKNYEHSLAPLFASLDRRE